MAAGLRGCHPGSGSIVSTWVKLWRSQKAGVAAVPLPGDRQLMLVWDPPRLRRLARVLPSVW